MVIFFGISRKMADYGPPLPVGDPWSKYLARSAERLTCNHLLGRADQISSTYRYLGLVAVMHDT